MDITWAEPLKVIVRHKMRKKEIQYLEGLKNSSINELNITEERMSYFSLI